MALEWLDCADGGLGLLGPRTAHAGGCFGRIRGLGLLWPSLGWRLALQGVWGLGIRGLLWGCLTARKSVKHPAGPFCHKPGPSRCHRLDFRGCSTQAHSSHRAPETSGSRPAGQPHRGDDLAPFLQVDFQHPYKSN